MNARNRLLKRARIRQGWLRSKPFRIYFYSIVLAVLPLSLFVAAAHNLFLRTGTRRVLASTTESGRILGKFVEQRLSEQQVFLNSIVLRPDIREDWKGGRYDNLNRRLAELRVLRPDFLSFSLVDVEGRLKAGDPFKVSSRDKDFSNRDWYTGVSRQWKPYVSSVYFTESEPHTAIIAIATPILDAQNRPAGILVGRQTVAAVTSTVYGLSSDRNDLFFFVDQRGQVFGRANGNYGLLPGHEKMLESIHARSSMTPAPSHVVEINSIQYVASYSPIPSLGWGVLIEIPTAILRAAAWNYEGQLAIVALIIILLALGGGALVAWLYKRMADNEHRYQERIEEQNRQLEWRNREAERANQMKSRFLATVSHELRTPLNAILGFSSLLKDDPAFDAQRRRWIGFIHEGGRHLLQLINDILDLSRIEAGRMELHRQVFTVEDAVPEVTSILGPLAIAKEVNIEVELEPHLVIEADRIRFKQILYNLLSNAVKFSETGGTVWLRSVRNDSHAEFEVRDEGIGIRAEDQQSIFEEFNRIELGDGKEGTGLGLAISRRLVEQHGGRLTVESEPGKGATFRFSLPLAAVYRDTIVAA